MIKPILVYRDIYRGPQPETTEDWEVLHDLGIKFTLDLETGSRFLDDGSPLAEQIIADAHGMRSFCHPLGRILPPTEKELRYARYIITQFRPIYIHCKQGVDRTGMVVASYTSHADFPETRKRAIAEMKQMGMHFWYYWWSWFL